MRSTEEKKPSKFYTFNKKSSRMIERIFMSIYMFVVFSLSDKEKMNEKKKIYRITYSVECSAP